MRFSFFLMIFSFFGVVHAQPISDPAADFAQAKMASMDLDDKLGQLFMIRAHSDKGPAHVREIEKQIKDYRVGGLCFFQGTPMEQARLVNKYQVLSGIPLMVAIDAEWGLGMRHKDSAISFPKQLTLGAIEDNSLIYEMGLEIADHLQRIGVQVNFAPVVDVNNNPANPVIHNRSFGEDGFNVATKSYAYMKGLQDGHVFACMKHFPGHGDTDVDSHYDLPVITHNRARLDSIEMMPFRIMTQLGVKSVMTAHLAIPALDDTPDLASSLSRKVVTDILQDEMHFDGLIFTDGLEMEGVAKHFKPGDMELQAIKAGNDIMLLPIDIAAAIKKLKSVISSGELDISIIDQKVEKILKAKYEMGLTGRPYVKNLSSINKDINNPKATNLKRKLYESAVTLVRDRKNLIPIDDGRNGKISTLALGAKSKTTFQETLGKFGVRDHFTMNKGKALTSSQKQKLKSSESVIISLHDCSIYASKDYGILQEYFDIIYELNSQTNVILVNNGSPYALKFFESIPTIVQSYEEDNIMQDVVAQAIFGVTAIQGRLPVSVGNIPVKAGIQKPKMNRLGYAEPTMVHMLPDTLALIDDIVQEMLDKKAAPGCQVLGVRNGRVFYNKAFGYHTDKKRRKVREDDIYDVASVTKTLATTISLMKLQEEGSIHINKPLVDFLPALDTTNKGPLIIEDVLAHHAGLAGWIAFYKETMEKDVTKPKRLEEYYRTTLQDSFTIAVTDKLYLRDDFRDTIYKYIYNNDLKDSRGYKYSDLGFYLFHQMIEHQTNQSLDKYVEETFYKPLGLKNTMFKPLNRVPKDRVVPSEDDDYFRDQVVHGHVHDMGAAMLGGVSGHAGLFSNAHDLAVLMQMLLNGGTYGGKQYLKPETIRRFTQRYHRSTRRGLGFDMKELDLDKTENVCEEASENLFGHLGFTGISVFADPDYDLIYIFLSNRTYPTMENKIFSKKNYRPRIQSVFYRAMMDRNKE